MINKEIETFSDETMKALKELGGVLQRIHRDMIAQGYEIVNGKVCKIKENIKKACQK